MEYEYLTLCEWAWRLVDRALVTHTHARTHTYTRALIENRETRTEQRKAVGETP